MQCPTCTDTALVMSDRQGVEIDYCPKCRGVWLDRGELDKIIEKSVREAEPAAPVPQPSPIPPERPERHDERRPEYRRDDYRRDDDDRRYHGGDHQKGYRRKSWLEEIFD